MSHPKCKVQRPPTCQDELARGVRESKTRIWLKPELEQDITRPAALNKQPPCEPLFVLSFVY